MWLAPVAAGGLTYADEKVKYGIPVKHVLLDNHSHRQDQPGAARADFPVWHTSLHNPDCTSRKIPNCCKGY